MNTPERHRSKRHPDEQDLVRIVAASDELRQLLDAAAAAPPSSSGADPAELAGQAKALAVFRAAQAAETQPWTTLKPHVEQRVNADQPPASRIDFAPDPAAREAPVRRSRSAVRRSVRLAAACRTRTIKLAIAGGLSAMVLTGMGVAAAAGGLPVPLQDAVHNLFDAPAPSSSDSASTAPGSTAPNTTAPSRGTLTSTSAQPSASLSRSPSSAPGSASRSPVSPFRSPAGSAKRQPASGVAAQVAGLCRAYRAGNKSARTLQAPGFAPLVQAAGGTAQVSAYCTKLIGTDRLSGQVAKPSATRSTGAPSKSTGSAAKHSAAKHTSAAAEHSSVAKHSSPAAAPSSPAAERASPAAKPRASSAKSSSQSSVDRAHSSKTSRPPTPKDQLPGDNQHRAKPPGDNGNRRLSGN